jgi:hypothetical protein
MSVKESLEAVHLYFYYLMIMYAKAYSGSSFQLGGVLVSSAWVVLGENVIGWGWKTWAVWVSVELVLGAVWERCGIQEVGYFEYTQYIQIVCNLYVFVSAIIKPIFHTNNPYGPSK